MPPSWFAWTTLTLTQLTCMYGTLAGVSIKPTQPGRAAALTLTYLPTAPVRTTPHMQVVAIELDDCRTSTIGATLPPNLAQLTALTRLSLADSGLGGSLPPLWSDLANLVQLNLPNNALVTGEIPEDWSSLAALTLLDISEASVTGWVRAYCLVVAQSASQHSDSDFAAPKRCHGLPYMSHVADEMPRPFLPAAIQAYRRDDRTPHNGRNPALLASLRQAPLLPTAPVCPASAALTHRALPASWGYTLTNLEVLRATDLPQLAATLPPEWAGLTNLRELQLSGPLLYGTLPPDWSSVQVLTKLLIAGDSTGVSEPLLTGNFPEDWFNGTAGMFDLVVRTVTAFIAVEKQGRREFAIVVADLQFMCGCSSL